MGRPSNDEKAIARALKEERKEAAAGERKVMRFGGYATNVGHDLCGICGKRPEQAGGKPCVKCSAEFFGKDWCGSTSKPVVQRQPEPAPAPAKERKPRAPEAPAVQAEPAPGATGTGKRKKAPGKYTPLPRPLTRSGSRRVQADAAPKPDEDTEPTPEMVRSAAPVLAPLAADTGNRPGRKRKRNALDDEPTLFTVRQ